MGRPIASVLLDAIGTRRLFLVLDNFEHLFPAVSFVADLVEHCPRLKVVVTSRELLRLSREHDMPIPPLDSPLARTTNVDQLARNNAVRLFVTRAESVRPGFRLTPETAVVVGEICRRLDGLPLALELAAARVRMLSPQALLTRLDRRLPLLTDGPRDRPARQRTLRDTIGWSYGLLGDEERHLFRTLGVFVGGCTLDAAEAVGQSPDLMADILNALGSLVDKNLVRQDGGDGDPRFSLLETIREFAQEQLEATGDPASARRRHAAFFLALAEQADQLLIGHDQVQWLDRLELDYGNLVTALFWAREARARGDTTPDGVPAALVGLRLAGALHWFWWLGGHIGEGRQWLDEVLAWEQEGNNRSARARALYSAGVLTMIQGEYSAAHRLLDQGAALAGEIGDRSTLGRCLSYRRIVEAYLHDEGRFPAEALLRTTGLALDALMGTTDAWGLALAQSLHGVTLRNQGDHQQAAQVLRSSIALAQTTGDRYLMGTCLPKLAFLLYEIGDLDGARALYIEALSHLSEIRDGWWASRCVQFLAMVAAGQGEPRRAALLLGIGDATLEAVGARRVPREGRIYEQTTASARAALGEAAFTEAYERGRSMSIESLLRLLRGTPAGSLA
jgi:predicted ATPase